MPLFCILFLLALPLTVYAETKTTTAEATYIMSEGETPATAESKAFDAAKQQAVDQLLPSVIEQTKHSKYPLSPEEVRTIAETTIEVEILAKQRMVVGEQFQFTVKVKATQRQDKVLAEVARKEKRLLAEKLTKEGETILLQVLGHQIDQKAQIRENNPEYEKAFELFNRAIDSDPTFAKAYAGRYRIYRHHLSQLDKALADITRAIQLEPNKHEKSSYYVVRAMTYKDIGETKLAVADWTEAILRDPNASYLWGRGKLLEELGHYKESILDYTRILNLDLKKNEEMYREFALRARASAYNDLKQYEQAMADYAALIRLTNGEQGFYDRGLTYMDLGEYDKAASDFTQEINRQPQKVSNDVFHMRALAYRLLGQPEKVIPDATEYLRRGPRTKQEAASVYETRGMAYSATKRTDNALADFTEATQADPYRASAYYRRGMQYAFIRVWDRAVMDLTEALRLTSMDSVRPEVKLADEDMIGAYTMRGQAHLNLNHPDQSLSDLDEALRRNPMNNHTMFIRGLAHAQLKDTDSALRDLREACRLGHSKACEAAQSVR